MFRSVASSFLSESLRFQQNWHDIFSTFCCQRLALKGLNFFGGTHCFAPIVRDAPDSHCCCVSVISASHQFLHGTTTIPMDKRDPNSRTRVTKILCMTTNPEEKRKIIGDVFVKVSRPTYISHPSAQVCTLQQFVVSLLCPTQYLPSFLTVIT